MDLEPIWASLLAKSLEGKNVKELLSNVGAGGAAPAVGGAPAAVATGAAPVEATKEDQKKEEEKEESDDDMVRSLALIPTHMDTNFWFAFIGIRIIRLISSLFSSDSIACYGSLHSAACFHRIYKYYDAASVHYSNGDLLAELEFNSLSSSIRPTDFQFTL